MTTDLHRLRSAGARMLPPAAVGRFRPLRAGIRNVWEYDDQVFIFSEGRLVLRGQNTAGKSKALELLFPFVLDGDVRSERLDPFGSKSKTMYWNLIEYAERATATGYCWAEFGRIDESGDERYVTCAVGMRANRSAGRKVDTWFAVTSARVGLDLDLSPDARPLTAEQLREALPDDGAGFTTTAREHRANVDHALFGLGPERYEALLHLLLQLRRPKLSEKLDMVRLADYLTDALPPLERTRMESLALAFARLDEETAEIERLEASLGEVTAFLVDYRSHAELQTRLRADQVRSANTQFDKVTEVERRERTEHEEAERELHEVEERREQLNLQVADLEGSLKGLDLSKVHALAEVEQRASQAEAHATQLLQIADGRHAAAEQAEHELAAATAEALDAEAKRDSAAVLAVDGAAEAGMSDVHAMHEAQLVAEPERARPALDGAAGRRRGLLLKLRNAANEAREARQRVSQAEARHHETEDRAETARMEASARDAAADAAAAAFGAAVDGWVFELSGKAAVPDDWADAATEIVVGGSRPDIAGLLTHARETLRDERADTLAALRRHGKDIDDLRGQKALVDAQTDDAPPAAPGRPALRPEGFAPLWACVDFAAALDDDARAGLEAALEAAGLLDALIAPGSAVVDPSTLDTWFTVPDAPTAASGPGVSAWLAPAAGSPLPRAAVAGALAAIDESCRIGLNGQWANGALSGCWTKNRAEFIGATARAEARRRRAEDLQGRIDNLAAAVIELQARDDQLAAAERDLAMAEAAFPDAEPLRRALRVAEIAAEGATQAADEEVKASEHLEEARRLGVSELAALVAAEQAAGSLATDVDEGMDAVASYRGAVAVMAAAAGRALRDEEHAQQSARRAADAELESTGAADAARQGNALAAGARAEADELRRSVGLDVATVLARQQQLTDALAGANAEQDGLSARRDVARDRATVAAERLRTTEEERQQREKGRATALAGLARLASTELATLALGPVDPERDLTQVTAGLAFARTAHERLSGVAVDQMAQDNVANRLHRAVPTLRTQLGAAFDPYLDSSDGIEVCFAALNGKPVGLTELSTALEDQVRRRRQTLSEEEREIIEKHLLTEVGAHLGERVHAAWSLVENMNEQLAAHPTRGGTMLKLKWETAADSGTNGAEALRLLRRSVGLLNTEERQTLAGFLHDRVRAARDDAEGADVVERLSSALDYRRWHRFTVIRRTEDGRDERLTAKTQGTGSGGEQAKLAHLPLFAATAAYYASARPSAPHLLMLDEAFAGIDDSQRGDCMGMLIDLDLDMVLTNFSEWGCYPEVPAVAIYHLERTPGELGVAALRFVWEAGALVQDDPVVTDMRRSPDTGLFA